MVTYLNEKIKIDKKTDIIMISEVIMLMIVCAYKMMKRRQRNSMKQQSLFNNYKYPQIKVWSEKERESKIYRGKWKVEIDWLEPTFCLYLCVYFFAPYLGKSWFLETCFFISNSKTDFYQPFLVKDDFNCDQK